MKAVRIKFILNSEFKNMISYIDDRFSRLRTPGAASVKAATKTQVRRQNAALTQLASSKNKRLIAQLEKRAALNTAVLKIKKV